MFVSDTLVFSPSTMKVRITNMEGVDIIDEFRPDLTVDMVKIRSLSQLFSPMESMKVSLYHKVLLVRTGKVLNEESTLQQEGLRDNGEKLFRYFSITHTPPQCGSSLIFKIILN